MFTQHTLTAGFDERKASRFTLRRTGKLAVSLAAFVAAGALVTGAAPASAAVRPAVSASAAYNRTTTNVFYYQAVLGTSFTATLQTNDGWNGNIVQFNWLNHSTSTGLNSWLYLPGASSFGHYYSGNSTIDWGNFSFIVVGPYDSSARYCVYLRNITNNVGSLSTQNWGQWSGSNNC